MTGETASWIRKNMSLCECYDYEVEWFHKQGYSVESVAEDV